MTEVSFHPSPTGFEAGIGRLVEIADDEFVPPLTGRGRADVTRSGSETGGGTVETYVERCVDRPLVAATDGDRLVGMLSFRQMDEADALDGYTPTNHVSIVIVEPEYRGRGIARDLYTVLIDELPSAYRQPNLSTKTWSTNDGHISLLESLGFECVTRVEDDRGEGVDTVYYARALEA